MGFLDMMSAAGDYISKRFSSLGNAYKDAWNPNWTDQNKSIWGEFTSTWSGVSAMASSLHSDDTSFGQGLRVFLDGTLGAGAKALQGTVGGLFEAPGLHEATWSLDKAYRYGVARPISWAFVNNSVAWEAANEADKKGGDALGAYLDTLLSKDTFIGDRGMWSDQIGKVTPGQAIIWDIGGSIGQLNPGNTSDPNSWSRSHDPRTEEGQAKFNSPNSEFLLKYASGTLDLLGNVVADPGHGTSLAAKAGKARLFDHTATRKYVATGGVEKEITTSAYQKVYEAALKAKTPEAFRWRVMPNARFGGQVAAILHTAAKMGEDVFRDSYVVARGIDGARDAKNIGAWERLHGTAPGIASDFAREFANWNIGEDAMMMGRNAQATTAVESLVLNDFDAFVAGMANREGIWGTLPGTLMNEAQPKVSPFASLRTGVHSWAMNTAPVLVGSVPAKTAQAAGNLARGIVRPFLATQGWTPFIDGEDPSALALRQLKANLERSRMAPDRVEFWVSNWGAKMSREGRNEVYERAETEALRSVADRVGLSVDVVKAALPDINRFRTGARELIARQRVYISERAARLAAVNVAAGRAYESRALKELNKGLSQQAKKGQFGDLYSVLPDSWGHANAIPLPDTRKMPDQAPDVNRPVLLSQTEQVIPTLDFRMLEGQLRWYKRQHPTPMFVDPATGLRRLPLNEAERQAANITVGEALVRPLAKLHTGWDALIVTPADFANMVWKSSALLRPAQMPRNLADDVLRRMLMFGKLPLIMGAMTGTRRAYQNIGKRGGMKHEQLKEYLARRGADRTRTLHGYATSGDIQPRDTKGITPNEDTHAVLTDTFGSMGDAWKSGAISLDNFIQFLEWMKGRVETENDIPQSVLDALNSRDQGIQWVNEDMFNTTKVPAGNQKLWHQRALKRRIVEIFYPNWQTKLLDDFRLRGTDATGTPLDSRYSPTDMRAAVLSQLIHKHTHERRGVQVNAPRGASTNTGGTYVGPANLNPEDAYRPAQMVINPFTGEIPTQYSGLEDFTILRHDTLEIKSKVSRSKLSGLPAGTKTNVPILTGSRGNPSEKMLNFIVDNLDDLMKPNHLLSMSVMPEGNIRIGVARLKDDAASEVKLPVKVSAKMRLRIFKFKEILDAGHQAVNIRVKNHEGGDQEITFPAAFGGPEGEAMQHRVSAEGGSGSYNYLVGDANMSRMLDQMGGYGNIAPGERGYEQSWERAVNAQISGDEVARKFLQGMTDSDVLTWLESTPEGTKYLHRMHYFGVNYVDHIHQIEAMVNEYVPIQESRAGRTLRQAVLERKATYEHLRAVRPDTSTMPEVHGASIKYTLGKGAIFDMIARGVDSAQKYISDIPTDKASRFPFFAESYRRHLRDLVETADMHAGVVPDDFVPQRLMDNLEKQARQRALYDTKYRLYDVAQLNDIARATRLIVPFSSAIMDSYLKYGRMVRDNPAIVLQGGYYWEMFDRNEQVQDENGYVLKKQTGPAGTEDHWYSVDPETGKKTEVPLDQVGEQRYVQFRFPSDLAHLAGKTFFGVDLQPVQVINKKSFNVFIDLPSTGPMVAIPANEFALSNPEFGESELIKKFVLPFGPSSSSGKVFIPAQIRAAWDIFAGEDGLTAETQAKAIFQTELIAYQRGERDAPPSFAEVRSRAGMMKGLRFATAFVSPLSFQTTSPYQPYIDIYRQLAAVDPKGADEAFLARYGDEFYAVAMTVTRNNASVRSTLQSWKSFEQHRDLIATYPDLAGLITGADGAGDFAKSAYDMTQEQLKERKFSKSVYEAQKQTPMRPGSTQMVREVMPLEESVSELEKRRTWQQYSKMQDLIVADMADKGLTSLRGRRAADLKKVHDAFVENNKYWQDPVTGKEVVSPWYKDFTSVDQAAMSNRIEAMWSIVQDPNLQKRDDIRGLIDYLTLREQIQGQMVKGGFATLTSKKAAPLAAKWRDQAFILRESNPAFGALWSRWLSHDDQLDLVPRKAV